MTTRPLSVACRPLGPQDLDALFECATDRTVGRMLAGLPWPCHRDDVAAWLETRDTLPAGQAVLAAVDARTGEVVGLVSRMVDGDGRLAGLRVWTTPRHRTDAQALAASEAVIALGGD